MAIIRNKSRDKYTVFDSEIFRDSKLSLKGRGLLTTLLSLPDTWEFSEAGLITMFEKDGQVSIRTAIKELENLGYLKRTKIRGDSGKFIDVEWSIFEKPQLENPNLVNPLQSNTNISNTNIYNICSSDEKHDQSSITKPSKEEPESHFEQVWECYPRKDGKNTAYKHYKKWLEGRTFAGKKVKLTERQMWYAVNSYKKEVEEKKTEKQYIKMGSTFFNESIYEYVQKNENEGVYNETIF